MNKFDFSSIFKPMTKKEFYIGQPLIIKGTGKKVTFAYDNGDDVTPYMVVRDDEYCSFEYCDYDELEPSIEFKFYQIIAGLDKGYFEVGTEFRIPTTDRTIKVEQGFDGLYLTLLSLTSKDINSTWILTEPQKEMTLEEIEAELGYKIKIKDNA